jgi:hypothetical protein
MTETAPSRQTIKRMFVVAIVGSVILTIAAPLWTETSVNYYFDGQVSEYKWTLYCGPFQVLRTHPAWPEINVPAEREIVWLGILLCLVSWFVLLFFGQVVLEELKRLACGQPTKPAQSNSNAIQC